ncbi:MAG: MiaB/RimO family radical SAM methylthiotransferase [Candidatus Coatesbacteria bacterium]|nr:MiaB/RimO family radical SAM methylthiotransferase [Candidatus Coatesbacteria bacterium]
MDKIKNTILPFSFSVITLGCAKNEVETSRLEKAFNLIGWEETSISKAEIVIVNSCAFIQDAIEETMQTIDIVRHSLKKGQNLFLYGCLVNLYLKTAKQKLNKINYLTLNDIKKFSEKPGKSSKKFSNNELPYYSRKKGGIFYLRVSDGCNNRCSYCTIPIIRGKLKSNSINDLEKSIEEIKKRKPREVNLISQDLSAWGSEKQVYENHYKLLKMLSSVPWIRFLYWHPARIDKYLADLYKKFPNLVSYLDTPIQHVSNHLLKKMNRENQDLEKIKDNLMLLKEARPDMVLRTTLMVGFPGETEKDFLRLADLVQDNLFTWIGIFAYSNMKNTLSYGFAEQIPYNEKIRRYNFLTELRDRCTNEKLHEFMDKTYNCLIIGKDFQGIHARPYFSADDIDGHVLIENSSVKIRSGSFKKIVIKQILYPDMIGEIIE